MTLQTATLLVLNKNSDSNSAQQQADKVAFEWAHVTFFPALAFHSVYESLVGTSAAAATKKAK